MTGVSVPELLQRAAQRPAYVSPLEAVMGEDWGQLKLGRGLGAAQLAYLAGQGGAVPESQRRAARAGAVRPLPQAMVKLIAGGGVSDAGGLKTQMAYLGREGAVPLRQPPSQCEAEFEAADVEVLARSWRLTGPGRRGADRTSHFIVSFPAGTDVGAAERAGRAWAEEMFDSGRFGDRWDYYTAFHSDTAYPHIHVVVARRGLEEETWLSLSRRGVLNYEVLREVQVEVAAHERIALLATPRLARGAHDRPVPDAEYRRAIRDGRAPVPPAHTAVTAVRAAVAVVRFARHYAADAEGLADSAPRLAAALERAALAMMQGARLVERIEPEIFSAEEVAIMTETLEEKRAAVLANFAEIDADLRTVPDPVARAQLLRAAAGIKAEAAPLLPERADLQAYRVPTPVARYGGLMHTAEDAQSRAVVAQGQREIAAAARAFGLDPDATLARHAGAPASLGLTQDLRAEELAERAASRAAAGLPAEDRAAATAELHRLHARLRAIHDRTEARLTELEAGRHVGRSAPSEGDAPSEAEARRARNGRGKDRETRRGRDGDDYSR